MLVGIAGGSDGGNEDGRTPIFFLSHQIQRPLSEIVTLVTDASLTGWEAVMGGHPARGLPDLRDHHVWYDT